MLWRMSYRADREVRPLADRHYNRQKVGAEQFVPPGRCLVLSTKDRSAFWVTSWPYGEYVQHAWAGAWMCSAFRNEGGHLASALIRDALSATRYYFGVPPELGLVSFIDRSKVRPTMVRGEEVWGWTWFKVGFRVIGETKGGLLVVGIRPEDMPPPIMPIGMQSRFEMSYVGGG